MFEKERVYAQEKVIIAIKEMAVRPCALVSNS